MQHLWLIYFLATSFAQSLSLCQTTQQLPQTYEQVQILNSSGNLNGDTTRPIWCCEGDGTYLTWCLGKFGLSSKIHETRTLYRRRVLSRRWHHILDLVLRQVTYFDLAYWHVMVTMGGNRWHHILWPDPGGYSADHTLWSPVTPSHSITPVTQLAGARDNTKLY